MRSPDTDMQKLHVYELQQASDTITDTSSGSVSSAAEQAQAESWTDGADQPVGAEEQEEESGLELTLDVESDPD